MPKNECGRRTTAGYTKSTAIFYVVFVRVPDSPSVAVELHVLDGMTKSGNHYRYRYYNNGAFLPFPLSYSTIDGKSLHCRTVDSPHAVPGRQKASLHHKQYGVISI